METKDSSVRLRTSMPASSNRPHPPVTSTHMRNALRRRCFANEPHTHKRRPSQESTHSAFVCITFNIHNTTPSLDQFHSTAGAQNNLKTTQNISNKRPVRMHSGALRKLRHGRALEEKA